MTVPVSVLARLITTRGSLPDHPIRPTIKTAEGDEKLLGLLTVGVLVIRASDFDVWYRSDRAKGKWPSQRSRLKLGGGRVSALQACDDQLCGQIANADIAKVCLDRQPCEHAFG